jgi:hypothetical protein
MYGVSKPTKGLDRADDNGIFNQVVGRDLSFLHTNDKSGRIFWFIFEKMDKVYQYSNLPRFSDDDSVALAQRSMPVQMNDKITFGDIWENRLAYKLVPLEEALFRHWTWGRLVCIGDSIHKVCSSCAGAKTKLTVCSGRLILGRAVTTPSSRQRCLPIS